MEDIRSSAAYGSYDTRADPGVTTKLLPQMTTYTVRFNKLFPTPPSVLVWLTGLAAKPGAKLMVKATANNVTESEFSLQIASHGGDRLRSAGVAWAAWPEHPERGEVTGKAGSVSTVVAGAKRLSNLNTTGNVQVLGVFFVALSAMDLYLRGDLWMHVQMVQETSSYGPRGTTWSMSAGPVGSQVLSARRAYASR